MEEHKLPKTQQNDRLEESWIRDGNCAKCRRQRYCSKQCTANKRATNAFIHDQIMERTGIGQMLNVIREAGGTNGLYS